MSSKLLLLPICAFFSVAIVTSCKNDKVKNDLVIANLNGKVKSVVEYQYEGVEKFGEIEPLDSQLYNRITFTYNEDGYLIEEVEETTIIPAINGAYYNQPVLKQKTVNIYDKSNKKIESNTYDKNDLLVWRRKYKYNTRGQIIEVNEYWGKGAQSYSSDYAEGSVSNKITYTYSGNIKTIYISDSKKIIRKDVVVCDSQGNEIIDTVYSYYFSTTDDIEYKADSSEQLRMVVCSSYNNDNVIRESNCTYGKFTSCWVRKFEYDLKHNRVKDFDSTNNDSTLYKYEFDKFNNWIKKTEMSFSPPIKPNDPMDSVFKTILKKKDFVSVRKIIYYKN